MAGGVEAVDHSPERVGPFPVEAGTVEAEVPFQGALSLPVVVEQGGGGWVPVAAGSAWPLLRGQSAGELVHAPPLRRIEGDPGVVGVAEFGVADFPRQELDRRLTSRVERGALVLDETTELVAGVDLDSLGKTAQADGELTRWDRSIGRADVLEDESGVIDGGWPIGVQDRRSYRALVEAGNSFVAGW